MMNIKLDAIQNDIQTFCKDRSTKKDTESDYLNFFPIQTLNKFKELDTIINEQ